MENKVIAEGAWLDPEEMSQSVGDFLNLLVTAAMIANVNATCVLCGAKQPHDLRWPAYAFELEPKDGGESVEVDYRACRSCEPKVDKALAFYGLPIEKQH